MKTRYLIVLGAFVLSIFGGLAWSAFHYSQQAVSEEKRADAAEKESKSTAAITSNVLRTVSIINTITAANIDVKKRITEGAQDADSDIKNAFVHDDCATRDIPDDAVNRLRQYADSLRTGTSGPTSGQLNR